MMRAKTTLMLFVLLSVCVLPLAYAAGDRVIYADDFEDGLVDWDNRSDGTNASAEWLEEAGMLKSPANGCSSFLCGYVLNRTNSENSTSAPNFGAESNISLTIKLNMSVVNAEGNDANAVFGFYDESGSSTTFSPAVDTCTACFYILRKQGNGGQVAVSGSIIGGGAYMGLDNDIMYLRVTTQSNGYLFENSTDNVSWSVVGSSGEGNYTSGLGTNHTPYFGDNGPDKIGVMEFSFVNLSAPEAAPPSPLETNIWNLSGKNVFVTNTSRDVAIGAEVPSKRLHVNGSANITGTLFITRIGINRWNPSHDLHIGDGTYSELDAGETQFTTSSSWEYKENIHPVRVSVLEKIAKIPVNTYDFKPEYCGVKQSCVDKMGLIAEDFHTVFGRGSDKDLNGQEVQMALWLAVQELKAENDQLKDALCLIDPASAIC